jgi:transposase
MRYELTDEEWTAIKPMLPNKPRGVPRVNDRRVLNGIFWVLRSGAPWRDLFRDRHKRWAGDAVDAAASAQLGLRPEKRRRTALQRTAKSCGPDASTPASSWQ